MTQPAPEAAPVLTPASPLVRYAVALAIVAVAFLARLALTPILNGHQPFVTLYPALLIIALWSGWRPALLALAVAFPFYALLILPPAGVFVTTAREAWIQSAVALFVSFLIIAVAAAQRSGRLRRGLLAREASAAAESLGRSERRFRAIFDQAAAGIGYCDASGRWLLVNATLCDIVGYTREELLARTFRDITHPDDLQRCLDNIQRLLRAEIPVYDTEKRFIRADGSSVWVQISVAVLRDGPGAPPHLAAVIVDITARRLAQARLEMGNQRLAILAHSAQELLRSDDPHAFLEDLFHRLASTLGLEVYFYYRAESPGDAGALRLAAFGGVEPEVAERITSLRPGQGICGQAASSGTPVVVADVQASTDPRTALIRALGLSAYACHPLIARGRPLGTLSFGTRTAATFDADALALLRAVSDQVAVAIDRHAQFQARQRSERDYRALVEQVPDYAIYRIDTNNQPVSWNEGVRLVLGYAEDEFRRIDLITGIFTPEDIAEGIPYLELAEAARTGSSSNDRWMRRKDGSRFYANGTTSALRDESGRLVGFAKVMRDLTEPKLAQERLRLSEERFRALSSATFDAILIHDRGVAIEVNRACEELFGFSRDELIGKYSIPLLVDPASMPDVLAHIGADSEKPYEAVGRRRDGSRIEIEVRARSIDFQGRRVRVASARDITQRKQVERDLRDAAARLTAVIDTAVDGIITIDERGVIESVNPATTRIFGYEPGEIIGANVSTLMPEPYRREHDGYLGYYAQTGDRRVIGIGREVRGRRKNGEEFPLELAVSETRLGDRTIYIGIVRDITDRKRAEEEIARHRDHLEEVLRERTAELENSYLQLRLSERLAALGTLAAGLGHDMGNLLLPLRTRLESIEAEVTHEAVRADVEAIRKAAEYLQRLTHGLRLLALDPDEARTPAEGTELHEWWPDVEPLLRNALPGGITLDHSLPPGRVAVSLSRPGLTQAVFNLVQNAGQAIAESGTGDIVTLWAEHSDDGGAVRIGVSDNGPGMPPEVVSRCLEPFFTTKARTQSTGMGLPLVRAAARRAGGDLEAHSEVGRGATFVLTLPVAARPEADGARRAAAALTIADPRMRSYVESLLTAMDFQPRHGPPQPGDCLWVADAADASNGDLLDSLRASPAQRIVLFADHPDPGSGDDRITALGPSPRPEVIRQAIRDAAPHCHRRAPH